MNVRMFRHLHSCLANEAARALAVCAALCFAQPAHAQNRFVMGDDQFNQWLYQGNGQAADEDSEAAEAERRKTRHQAKVRLFVAILEQSCPLKSSQRDALVDVLLKETRPALRSSEYDWYVVVVQAGKIPDDKLKPTLDKAQRM